LRGRRTEILRSARGFEGEGVLVSCIVRWDLA
jgi:hypothetical protein